jgi:hypothetical protein
LPEPVAREALPPRFDRQVLIGHANAEAQRMGHERNLQRGASTGVVRAYAHRMRNGRRTIVGRWRSDVRTTLAVLTLVAASCGGAAVAPPATPSAAASAVAIASNTPAPAPTQTADIYNFVADLKSSNEVPPIADAEASCAGQAKIVLAVITDPSYYNVVKGDATFDVTLTGCPATTSIILAHIHAGTAAQNGPVKVDTGLVATQPIAFGTGAKINKMNVSLDPAVADDLIKNPGNYYFNVHSAAHGGGVVRGQLLATR